MTSLLKPTPVAVSASEARKNLVELVERTQHREGVILITRHNRPMAWLVGGEMFRSLFRLIQEDSALQDTLALMLNQEARDAIQQGESECENQRSPKI